MGPEISQTTTEETSSMSLSLSNEHHHLILEGNNVSAFKLIAFRKTFLSMLFVKMLMFYPYFRWMWLFIPQDILRGKTMKCQHIIALQREQVPGQPRNTRIAGRMLDHHLHSHLWKHTIRLLQVGHLHWLPDELCPHWIILDMNIVRRLSTLKEKM